MSTQYNQIQGPYDLIRRSTISLLERENIHTTILPFVKNARVLDLACGSGSYTYAFLSWGAASVVGVDISSGMLDAARRSCPADVTLLESPPPPSPPPGAAPAEIAAQKEDKTKTATFIEADIGQPDLLFDGGGYDIVFGGWLLNYAPNCATLTRFYENIARNLRDDGAPGIFLSITVPPSPDPRQSIAAGVALRPWSKGASGGMLYEPLEDVDGGVLFRVRGETAIGSMVFDCWWLQQRLYEECARAGGMRGQLKWGKTDARAWLARGEWEGGATREEMETYEVCPYYGVLMVRKE